MLARVERLLKDGVVETYGRHAAAGEAQSILLHGDTPGAVALGKSLRALVENAGVDGHAGFADCTNNAARRT